MSCDAQYYAKLFSETLFPKPIIQLSEEKGILIFSVIPIEEHYKLEENNEFCINNILPLDPAAKL